MPSFAAGMAQARKSFARLRHFRDWAQACSASERKCFVNHKPLGLPADEDVRQADGALTIMAKLRYYDAAAEKPPAVTSKTAVHTEFLRTGRINRRQWMPTERRYLSYEEVADRTGKKLSTAGDTTHKRINGFHASIQFPKLIFHRTLVGKPHLGYCHVTAARTAVTPSKDITWSFYFANFSATLVTRRISSTASRPAIPACTSRSRSSRTPKTDRWSSIATSATTGFFRHRRPKGRSQERADAGCP